MVGRKCREAFHAGPEAIEVSIVISGGQAVGPLPGAPARRRSGGFSVGEEAVPEARVAAPGSVGGLAALIGLQSGGEPVEDREARRYGGLLLAQLDDLHRALLGDAAPAGLLDSLSAVALSPPGPALDAGLADAVGAIRLRAMVELARYGAIG